MLLKVKRFAGGASGDAPAGLCAVLYYTVSCFPFFSTEIRRKLSLLFLYGRPAPGKRQDNDSRRQGREKKDRESKGQKECFMLDFSAIG
jgi:hypothetical protein